MEDEQMTQSELEIIYETTTTLNKMCQSNHDYSTQLVAELQKLVGVIKQQETRIAKLEAK
jgi:hypothetical protein